MKDMGPYPRLCRQLALPTRSAAERPRTATDNRWKLRASRHDSKKPMLESLSSKKPEFRKEPEFRQKLARERESEASP